MAYVSGKEFSNDTALGTSLTATLPPHVSGDLLVVFFLGDTTANDWTTPTQDGGWNTITNGADSSHSLAGFWIAATSSSMTDPSSTVTSCSNRGAMAFVIKDADTADPINVSGINTDNSGLSFTRYQSPSVTTDETDVLILCCGGNDGNRNPQLLPGQMNLFHQKDVEAGQTNMVAGWTYQRAIGASGQLTWAFQGGVDNGLAMAVGINNNAAVRPGYGDPSNPPSDLIVALAGNSNPTFPAGTYFNVATTITSIDSISTSNVSVVEGGSGGVTVDHSAAQINANTATNITLHGCSFTSRNMTGKKLLIHSAIASADDFQKLRGDSTHGFVFGLRSNGGTAWRWYSCGHRDSLPIAKTALPTIIDPSDTTLMIDSSGTWDNTDVDAIAFGSYFDWPNDDVRSLWNNCHELATITVIGGSSGKPAGMDTVQEIAESASVLTVQSQLGASTTQFLCYQDIQVGNGSEPVYWNEKNVSVAFPSQADGVVFNSYQVFDESVDFSLYGVSGDTISFTDSTISGGSLWNFTIHASSTSAATWDFSGLTIINANPTLRDIGTGAYAGISFVGCTEIIHNGADLTGGVSVSGCTAAQAITVTSEAQFNKLLGMDFNRSTALSIKITGNQTGTWSATGMTVANGQGSYDIEYTGTTDFTIEFDVGSGWSQSRVNNSSTGTLTASTPTTSITINSDVASSDIKLFDGATTQTVTDSTTGTSLSYTYSGTKTWYYTVQKAGYLPVRGSLTGTDENLTANITMVEDPVYNASHGLTFTTDYSYNATTRVMTIVAAQQGRDLYSALIDDFISQSTLYNRPFPLAAVGIDRIDFKTDGTTAATIDSGDIQFWRGAGMEWEHATTGNKTHKFCSVVGTGTNASGTKGYYQQVDGASPTALSLVSNNVDQVIQYYSDPNGDGSVADGYDYSGHLVIKLFNDGYYQRSNDVLTAYGISALESFEYVLPFQMTSTGLGTGDRSITITVTDTTPTGTEYQTGYTFDYKIEGGASDSPEDLLRQWIYDVYTDPTASTYASKINFNWPDPLLESGGNYETQRGFVYGQDTTTTYSGFYVEEGSDYHPDFLRQQANDGTYFVTPILAQISITGLADATGASNRLQITNTTALSASSWATGTAYSVGDVVLRTTGVGTENTAGLYFRCTTAGTSHATTEPTWDTTAGNTTSDNTVVWTCYKVLFYDADPTATSYSTSYTDGNEFLAGESYRVRYAEMDAGTSFKTYETTGVVATSGFSIAATMTSDSTYSTNALDGSSYDGTYSPNYTSDYLVLDTNTDYTGTSAYAYFCYLLTTSQGMYSWWGGVTAVDDSNYRFNVATVDMYLDETAGFVKQTDDTRIFRSDGARPALDPTTGGNGIEVNWKVGVRTVETGVSGLTGAESAQLLALGTASQVADAVWDEAQADHTTSGSTGEKLNNSGGGGSGLTLGEFIALQ